MRRTDVLYTVELKVWETLVPGVQHILIPSPFPSLGNHEDVARQDLPTRHRCLRASTEHE